MAVSDWGLVKCLLVQARAILYEASVRADDYSPEGEDIAYNLHALVHELDYWIERVEKRGGAHG